MAKLNITEQACKYICLAGRLRHDTPGGRPDRPCKSSYVGKLHHPWTTSTRTPAAQHPHRTRRGPSRTKTERAKVKVRSSHSYKSTLFGPVSPAAFLTLKKKLDKRL